MTDWYKFNHEEYRHEIRGLADAEDLAYRRLIDLYYSNEGPLPADKAVLERIVALEYDWDQIYMLDPVGYLRNGQIKKYTSSALESILSGITGVASYTVNPQTNIIEVKSDCDGTFINCTAGDYSFAYDADIEGGKLQNCTAGDYSFAAIGNIISGATLNNCIGGLDSFSQGVNNITGTLIGCILTNGSFNTLNVGLGGQLIACANSDGSNVTYP